MRIIRFLLFLSVKERSGDALKNRGVSAFCMQVEFKVSVSCRRRIFRCRAARQAPRARHTEDDRCARSGSSRSACVCQQYRALRVPP